MQPGAALNLKKIIQARFVKGKCFCKPQKQAEWTLHEVQMLAHWPWTEVTLWESEQCVTPQKANSRALSWRCRKENSLLLCLEGFRVRCPLFLQVISKFINTHTNSHITLQHMHTSFPDGETCSLTLQRSNFLFSLHQHVLLCILLPPKHVGASIEVMLLA